MIIYGSRSSHLKTVQLEKEACPHCQTQGSVTLSTFTRYAHVFWIPFFSVGRFSVSQCQHCKQTLEEKQMPAQIRTYHYKNLADTRLPMWQFAGLFLLAVSIAVGVYTNAKDKTEQAAFLQTPLAGDVYEVKTKTGSYTTFRVVNFETDTVLVNLNSYEVDKATGIRDIDKSENYSDSLIYALPHAELKQMFSAGEILDINRK